MPNIESSSPGSVKLIRELEQHLRYIREELEKGNDIAQDQVRAIEKKA